MAAFEELHLWTGVDAGCRAWVLQHLSISGPRTVESVSLTEGSSEPMELKDKEGHVFRMNAAPTHTATVKFELVLRSVSQTSVPVAFVDGRYQIVVRAPLSAGACDGWLTDRPAVSAPDV